MSLKYINVCIILPCAIFCISALICFIIPHACNEIISEEVSLNLLASLTEDRLSEYLLFLLLISFPSLFTHIMNCWICGLNRGQYSVVTGYTGWTQDDLKAHLDMFCDGCLVIDEVTLGNSKTFRINLAKDHQVTQEKVWEAVKDSQRIGKDYSFTIMREVMGNNRILPVLDSEARAQAVITSQPTSANIGPAKPVVASFPVTQQKVTNYGSPQPITGAPLMVSGLPTTFPYGSGKTPQVTYPVAKPDASAAWNKQEAELIRIAPPTRDRQLVKDSQLAQPGPATGQHQSRATNRYTPNDWNKPRQTNQNQAKPYNPDMGGGFTKVNANSGAKALFCGFMAKKGGPQFTVEIAQGNLIHEHVGAIVNPANVHLNHGGGAAKAIADAAGRELLKDCDEVLRNRPRNTLQLGDAVSTTAGKLRPRIQYVIHACGPRNDSFGGNDQRIYQTLRDSFYRSMECANSLPVDSISIPAIGSGIYGLDKSRTAHEAFTAVEDFVKFVNPPVQLRLIRFVNVDAETTEIFLNVFGKRYLKCSVAVQGASTRSRSAESRPRQEININGKRNRSSSQGREDVIINMEFKKVEPENSDYDNVKRSPKKTKNHRNDSTYREDNNFGRAAFNYVEESETSSETTKLIIHNRTKYEATSPRKDGSRDRKPNQSMQIADRKRESSSSAEKCPICISEVTSPKKLKCGHVFCTDCIDMSFKTCGPKCPTCGLMLGVRRGNQPEGTMTINVDHNMRLPGYEKYGAIVIMYIIPDGIQGAEHPNPGQPYQGTTRKAFLPDCPEGQKVCDLLKKAFDQRLIFTVGRSATSGRDNVVTWNDIHHKTTLRGQFGYPDDTYLTRVKDELAAKGITDEDGGSRGRESSF